MSRSNTRMYLESVPGNAPGVGPIQAAILKLRSPVDFPRESQIAFRRSTASKGLIEWTFAGACA